MEQFINKRTLFFNIIIILIALSCTSNKTSEPGNNMQTDSVQQEKIPVKDNTVEPDILNEEPTIPQTEVISFLKEYQMLFRKNKIEKICDRVNYPLEGDCVFYYCFGEDIFNDDFSYDEHKIDRKVFRKNFHKIFSKEAIRLIDKADIDQLVTGDEYTCTIKDTPNTYYTIRLSQDKDYFILYISYIDEIESINEHSVTYRFRIIDGEIKLYLINCAG